MTRPRLLLLCASLIMLFTAAGMMIRKKKPIVVPGKDMVRLEVRPIKMSDGWGYDILADNKIYIHQDVIPAIASPKRFVTEAEAQLTGDKVIEKLMNGKLPAITRQELQMMKIHF